MTIRAEPAVFQRVIRAGKHTQASLGREIGYPNVWVWVSERGIPDRWLPKVAQALGLSERELVQRLRG